MKTVLFFLLSCGWINGMSFAQELSLHPLLRDGAVLQRDVPMPITGLAPAGAQVWLDWKNKTYTTSADTSGKWALLLPPGPAETQGQTLRVKSGTSSLQITNLLVGEVWLASGQSNMEWILAECVTQSAEAAKAADPLLRFTTIPRIIAETPAATVPVTWQAATPDSVLKMSAVAYFFARELRRELQVPIGIISSAFGGTPAEAWIPEATFDTNPKLAPAMQRRKTYPDEYPNLLRDYEQKKTAYEGQVAAARLAGLPPPFPPYPPPPVGKNPNLASVLWNGMIHPLLPFPIRGVIWYQGEANVGQPDIYESLLSSLITAWRAQWKHRGGDSLRGLDRWRWRFHSLLASPDFPFLVVQLTDFNFPPEGASGTSWARLRDAQAAVTDRLPSSGLAVTLGLGEAEDIHPQRKMEVGQRLALLARKIAYGQEVPCVGPILEAAQSKGEEMELTFRSVHGSLRTSDGKEPGSFTLAGQDRKFYPAQAKIDGTRLVLTGAGVPEPVFVRYAWSNRPENPNLTDDSGLPARPFRTDPDPSPAP